MKKFFYFASALLTVFMSYSCANFDNSITEDEFNSTVIEDANGNKYNTRLVATFKGEVGTEVSLKLGVYDAFDIYGVDFGDGTVVVDTVGHHNKGVCVDDGTTTWPEKPGTTHTGITEFKGTIAGEGIIKVLGKSDVWYLAASGAVPTSMDQNKLLKVVQFTISKVAAESIDLTGLDSLEIFGFSQGSLKSINVSNNIKLKDLTINNNTASAYESVLESLDVTKNVNLEKLNLMAASATKPGKLQKLDLSNNAKLANLYAQYNALTEVILPAGAALSFANLQNNQLESIDLTTVTSFKDIYLNNNKLKTVDLSKLTAGANLYLDGNELTELTVPVSVKNFQANNNKLTKISLVDCTASCKIENNCLTFETLPVKPASLNTANKIKKFTYAPQADMEVTPNGYGVDLHAQATAQGILEAPVETSFTIKAGDKTLTKDTDYEIGNGLIAFKKAQMNVVVEMTSTAFPNLTLKTKPFTVGQTVMFTPSVNSAAPKSGEVVNLHNGLVTLTFGEEGGADFKAFKEDGHIEGYTVFTEGNGVNGNKTGGTFYTIKPDKDGIVEVAVVLNSGKAFFVEEDGTALADYNGIKKDAKYYGTFVFEVKAQKNYKFYCSGSKLGFYGFKYVY